jgi:hypothetical protein
VNYVFFAPDIREEQTVNENFGGTSQWLEKPLTGKV